MTPSLIGTGASGGMLVWEFASMTSFGKTPSASQNVRVEHCRLHAFPQFGAEQPPVEL